MEFLNKSLSASEKKNILKNLKTILYEICEANRAIDMWKQSHPNQFGGPSAVEEYEQMVAINDGDDEIYNFSHQLKKKLGNDALVIILTHDTNFRNRVNSCFGTPTIPACAPCAIFTKLNEILRNSGMYKNLNYEQYTHNNFI